MAKQDKKRATETYDWTKGQAQDFNQRSQVGYAKNMQDYDRLMGGFQNFIDTGGFTDQGLSDIRNRSNEPVRAAYANAEREVSRNRALQGDYSPNMAPTLAKMAREQGQLGSDASRNTEAGIAEMVQRGKLAGLQGSTSLYGTTPALASTFGNQALSATGNQIQASQAKTGTNWGSILSGAGSALGAALPLFSKLPFGGGKKKEEQPKTPAGTPLASAPSGTEIPGSSGPIGPDQPQLPIPSSQGPGGIGDVPQDPSTPNVSTDYNIPNIPITKPDGSGGQANLIPGSVPPLYMDEDYNLYYDDGSYAGNVMTGENAGGGQ